jgi:hypothetical protein
MNVGNTVRTFRELSLVTGKSVLYELARRAASKIHGINSTEDYLNYQFFDKKLSLWREYITDNERRVLQFLAIPPESLALTANKADFSARCSELGIPTPATKCLYMVESRDPDPRVDAFRDGKKFDSFIRSLRDGSYLMKPVTGRHGDGIVKFDVCKGDLVDRKGRDTTARELIERASSNPYGDSGLIVQEFIRPHRNLQPVMNGPGLGTIRFVTLTAPDGEARAAWAVLKLPLRDSITDNFSVGQSGNLIAAIDVDCGKILRVIGLNKENGFMEEQIAHPETHTMLQGFELPAWDDTLRHVCSAASAFKAYPSLGWDVALSDRGPVFIEMNTYWGCTLIQLAYDRGIREEILNHYGSYGIDLTRYDEILAYLRTDDGRAAERGL